MARPVYLPYSIVSEKTKRTVDHTGKSVTMSSKDTDVHWIREMVNQFTGNVCDKIIMSPSSKDDLKPAGAPVLDIFSRSIVYRDPRNIERVDRLAGEFEEIIRPIKLKYASTDGFTSDIATYSRMLFWWLVASRRLNANLISRVELDRLLTGIETALSMPENRKYEDALYALDDFRRILNSYKEYPLNSVRVKASVLSSPKTVWKLEDIILRDRTYRKACGITQRLSQQGTRIQLNLRKLGEHICDFCEQNSDIVEMAEKTISIPTGNSGKVAALHFACRVLLLGNRIEGLPIIFQDKFDVSIPEGSYIKRFPDGQQRFVSGRCHKCSNPTTELHAAQYTYLDMRDLTLMEIIGKYLFCKKCGFSQLDEETGKLRANKAIRYVKVLKNEVVKSD